LIRGNFLKALLKSKYKRRLFEKRGGGRVGDKSLSSKRSGTFEINIGRGNAKGHYDETMKRKKSVSAFRVAFQRESYGPQEKKREAKGGEFSPGRGGMILD